MQYFSVFLINGFLLSITPSTVTDSKCSNQLPVIQDNCKDSTKPSSLMFPAPQPQIGTENLKMDQNKIEQNATPSGCLESKAC